MPYVSRETKARFGPLIPPQGFKTAGELTYALQQVVQAWMRDKPEKYQTLAEVLGAIEGLKADLIRRKVTPLEELAQSINGDVWDAPQ